MAAQLRSVHCILGCVAFDPDPDPGPVPDPDLVPDLLLVYILDGLVLEPREVKSSFYFWCRESPPFAAVGCVEQPRRPPSIKDLDRAPLFHLILWL